MTQVLYYIDYGNKNSLPVRFHGQIMVIEFDTDIATTIKHMPPTNRIVWIASSICDYTDFTFDIKTAEPDRDTILETVTYVYPSDTQSRGDTFLLHGRHLAHLASAGTIANSGFLRLVQDHVVPRIQEPIVEHEHDVHAPAILEHDFIFPYSTFRAWGHPDIEPEVKPCFWERKFQETTVTTTGATQITVLASAKSDIKKEVWDYLGTYTDPYLKPSLPLDIVFFSNGEAVAEQNWNHLLEITRGISNRVVRVDGVMGRVASQHAAARAATTPWYFLINAKLEVDPNFDWSWQPDRMQASKHYIFRADNPVTGLRYGHMAMVCNNRKLTLATQGTGLDFTMESPVCVVDILSGVARYNTDPWTTWRTAFREVIKLRYQGDSESLERLEAWLKLGTGDYADVSQQGALDAIDYYNSVLGDRDKIRLTYDWQWIENYYSSKNH